MARPDKPLKGGRIAVYRHPGVVRATHWINAICLFFLLASGMQIFNASPQLYFGDTSTFGDAAAGAYRMVGANTEFGLVRIGELSFRSDLFKEGFPWAITLPGYRDLATGRNWHFFFAWLLVINGLVYLGFGLVSGRFRRVLAPTGRELKGIGHSIVEHARLRFPKGEEARRYNVLQKLAYLGVIFVLLPMMLVTGLCMSPGFNAGFTWLVEAFGGRQSARSFHFITAALIVAFVAVHLLMIVLAGPINEIRSMITGRYVIAPEGEEEPME